MLKLILTMTPKVWWTYSLTRFGHEPIKSTYLVDKANFVACHNPAYINIYNMVQDLVDGGTFLLNCNWDMDEIEAHLPGQVKAYMAKHNIKFYVIDGFKIGEEIGLGTRINTVLQSAFFKLSGVIPVEDAVKYMKDAATAAYGSKGETIVKMNHDAIDRGIEGAVEVKVPAEWANAEEVNLRHKVTGDKKDVVDYVNNIATPVNATEGYDLPVSAFVDYVDGTSPHGTSAYEKRGLAVEVASWNPDNCIQCNFCSYVCPHASIRPLAMNSEQRANAPDGTVSLTMNGLKNTNLQSLFHLQIVKDAVLVLTYVLVRRVIKHYQCKQLKLN